MNPRTTLNVVRNAVRPSYGMVMIGKLLRRLEPDTSAEATRWSNAHAISTARLCTALDPTLWVETVHWHAAFEQSAREKVSAVGVDLGGGGDVRALYFLTRLTKPSTVVETGVAAGWSSAAILAALDSNGHGTLYSSDFPYFRLSQPEQYIGILVPNHLRERWHLQLAGDRKNLPKMLAGVDAVDLFHFDSDKSMRGRRFATRVVTNYLTASSISIFDDIHNNVHFMQLVERSDRPWAVLENHVGVVGVGVDP